ncbi:LOW QUALITY PROTEIN: protein asteroid-like [Pecten maximus]|uniref:LOW QUALITY PROTEIN: protein asteroid-like n=1 Tax=Pecten maximus TaxID=6579 RepID=UPI001458716A|nr:LOW QUALITY PROTEIN: protein asteroid-like [Pecten maximus]
MGIPGLTTFIDNNLHLLERFELHDSKLIIDGNNLYHLLFYDHRIDYVHGGDYDKFANHTRHFFLMLKECNIQPYVIFDGGYDIDEKKLNTALERSRQRCHLAGFISHGGKGKIMPVLAYEAFRRTLLDLGVPHCVCDFEADDQIAVLANEFNAPVLSFDSDFYIFDLKAGYIPFDGVNFVSAESEDKQYKYLPCCIYYTKNLTKHFPDLGKSVLPLIATMLGNDFVEHWVFQDFFQKLSTPKKCSFKFDIPIAHTKMRSLFHWLDSVKCLESGIEKVLSCFKDERLVKVEQVMKMSLKAYSSTEQYSRVNLRLLLEGSSQDVEDQCHKCESELPVWFRCSFWKGEIAQFCQNVVMLQRVILNCQVEDMNAPSATNCCQSIRSVIYRILTSRKEPDGGNTGKTSVPGSVMPDHVTECTREIKNMRKFKVEPTLTLPEFGVIPCLADIPTMEKDERISLLFAVLDLSGSRVLEFPEELQLTMAVLIYWIRKSDPHVTVNQVRAMIHVSLPWKHVDAKSRQFLHNPGQRQVNSKKLSLDLHQDKVEKFLQNLRKYFNKLEHSKKHPVDVKIIHGFSQFQACFLYTMILNQILQKPLHSPNPASIFNGSFLYSFTKSLDSRPNIHLYIPELFVKHSPILDYYNNLYQAVMDHVGESHFHSSSVKPGKKQKRDRKKRAHKIDESPDNFVMEEGSDPVMEVQVACDVSNRFSAFGLLEK